MLEASFLPCMAASKKALSATVVIENYTGRRVLAYIIDAIVLAVASGFLSVITPPDLQPLVGIVLFVAYDMLMVVNFGQTLGKMVVGVRVALASSGKLPDNMQAFRRTIIKAIPLVPIVLLVQMLMGKLPLHDSFAGTKVVLD